MAESVLTRQLARLRVAYGASPLKRFLTWWGRELWALAPPRMRHLFADRREELLLRLTPAAIELQRRGQAPLVIERPAEPADIRPQVERITAGGEEPPRVVFALPVARVLRRTLTLPAAAEENLRQVLTFEMDRQTPFRADQVYFDQRVAARDTAARQLRVDIALLPRAAIDPELAQLDQYGAALDAIDCVDEDGRRCGFNLLPAERRARRPNLWLRINVGLALAVVVLLFVVMAQSVANRAQALEKLRAHTKAVQTEANAVASLRNTLRDAVEGANFLTQKRNARPALSDVMLDVTNRLDNDTWLQRLSVNGEQIQLQGQSKNAAGLITVLQQSGYLDAPALQGAITNDARSGKEQFLIQAKVKLPAPETTTATGPAPITEVPPLPTPGATATPPAATDAPKTTPADAAPTADPPAARPSDNGNPDAVPAQR